MKASDGKKTSMPHKKIHFCLSSDRSKKDEASASEQSSSKTTATGLTPPLPTKQDAMRVLERYGILAKEPFFEVRAGSSRLVSWQ